MTQMIYKGYEIKRGIIGCTVYLDGKPLAHASNIELAIEWINRHILG